MDLRGVIISVSKVNVTTDLSMAKVYLSIFPNKEGERTCLKVLNLTHH